MLSEQARSIRTSLGRHGAGPMVVEFIGTPGAGKTTLSIEAREVLRHEGTRADSIVGAAREHARRTGAGRVIGRLGSPALQRRALWQLFYALGLLHAAAFAREHASLARHVLRTQLRRPLPVTRRAHVLYWFFQLGGRHRFLMATAHDFEAFVVDDGFVHRAVHLHASSCEEPDADAICTYVDLLRAPDLVVFVTAPHEVCLQRVVMRGLWRHSRHLTPTELSCSLLNSERAARIAVDRARRRGWPVVEIANGEDSLDRARRDLERALRDWLACARSDPVPQASGSR